MKMCPGPNSSSYAMEESDYENATQTCKVRSNSVVHSNCLQLTEFELRTGRFDNDQILLFYDFRNITHYSRFKFSPHIVETSFELKNKQSKIQE
jgi:hypothetical protein